MRKLNLVSMLIDPNVMPKPNLDGGEGNQSDSYVRLLKELQFLLNTTRSNQTFAVNKLALYIANPRLQHISTIKRVLHYLAETKDYKITYLDFITHPNNFHGFADAAFRGDSKDGKSTAGYVFLTAKGAMTQKSRKQTIIHPLTTEAKYMALSEASCKICWLRVLHKELGFKQKGPILLWGDNEGAIALMKNPQSPQ
jgi:hypothetical protein